MSVCVTIRTEKKLRPNVYLKYLAENGEHIVVTSENTRQSSLELTKRPLGA